MDIEKMVEFAKNHLGPIKDLTGSPAYRCSAYLTDGVYLPCILLAPAEASTDLAMRRFDETKKDALTPKLFGGKRFGHGMRYRDIVKSFVTTGNCVNYYDVERLEESPFAISLERLSEVKGETSMGWTQFTAEMSDGTRHQFGTAFHSEFFQMPPGYTSKSIAKIHPHPAHAHRVEGVVYRERPFFTCFIDGLGAIRQG